MPIGSGVFHPHCLLYLYYNSTNSNSQAFFAMPDKSRRRSNMHKKISRGII